MVKLGVVGLGWWGNTLAEAATRLPARFAIGACYSPKDEDRSRFVATFGGVACDSYESLVTSDAVDAVVLATPHLSHSEQILTAAAAGKHVFVEKPLSVDRHSAMACVAVADEAGIVLAVGHNRRFTPAARALRERVVDGAFGQVLHIEANFSVDSALSYAPGFWRGSRAQTPGGPLASLGIHMLDTAQFLFGPVTRLSALLKRHAVSVDMDDTAALLLEFESGITGYVGSLYVCPMSSSFRVYGTDANAFVDEDFTRLQWCARGSDEATLIDLEPADSLSAELDCFADACEGKRSFPVLPAEAAHNSALLEASVVSAEAGGAWQDLAVEPGIFRTPGDPAD